MTAGRSAADEVAPADIVFVNRVYPPDLGATGEMLRDLAQGLAARGLRVAVVAAGPAGRIERDGGVTVVRARTLAMDRSQLWRRGLSYLSTYPSLLGSLVRLGRPAAIVTMTDPPLVAALGPLIGRVTGARLVHWAQDLYPEVAVAAGVLRAGRFDRRLTALSSWALGRHDRIVAVGACMAGRLQERGLPAPKIAIIPNWADAGAIHPIDPEANGFRAAHGFGDRFVVMYSGNFGLAHDFAAILEAAALLDRAAPDVLFALVGDGPALRAIRARLEGDHLANVVHLPFQPRPTLAESLSAADVHLVSMRADMAGLVVPSKAYGVLAAGRPCLFVGPEESEIARVLAVHGCGATVPPGDGARLAAEILRLRDEPGRRQAMGRAARQAALGHGREAAVEAFLGILGPILDAAPRRAR